MGNIDLHIHSIYSDDGEFTIEQLMRKAEAAGLIVAAIADHDSVKACLDVEQMRHTTNVRWIDAIEISCRHNGIDLHLLGYFINSHDKRFTAIEVRMRANEDALTAGRLTLLEESLGVALPLETLMAYAKGKILTGERICEWLLENDENRTHPALSAYFQNGSRSDNPQVNFYWDYLAQGKAAYLPSDLPTMSECIRLIHEVGGVAILAHPGKSIKENHLLLDELVVLGLDGIEAFSSYHNEVQIAYYAAYAKKKNIILTCGSDYHGKTKPRIKVGMTHCLLDAKEIMLRMERGRK